MKLIIKQRFPTSKKPQISECNSPEDVYNIPFVDAWMSDPDFYKLSKSTNTRGPHFLIAETHKGKSFFVIGIIEGDIDELLMPEWQKQK